MVIRLILVLLIVSCTPKKVTMQSIFKAGVLRVGMTGDYPPFSLYDEKTKTFSGIDVDMAKDLAADMKIKLEFVKTSWPTLMQDFREAKYDIAISGISITQERMKEAMFSNGYYHNGKAPIARCDRIAEFDSIEKLNTKKTKVIFNPGGTNEKFAKSNLSNATHILHQDNKTIFLEIIQGRADVMVTDKIEVLYQSKQHPELCASMPGKTFTQSQIGILLPQDREFKRNVDKWLIGMQRTGRLDKVFQQYLK
jgi:cyclohexadienyl dehydratase